MSDVNLHLDMVFVFFIYGLSFFSMGIALTLETGRTPLLAEKKVLRPLAIFGLLHGAHEWMEIILLQGVWLDLPFPQEIDWLRVVLLIISFIPLVLFAVLMFNSQLPSHSVYTLIIFLILLVGSLQLLNASGNPPQVIPRADALARYLLAIPGGILAGLALFKRSRQVQSEGHWDLARTFQWAALGMALYGLTQVFVPPLDVFPASYINSAIFQDKVGFPVQVVRASMAVLVTINLIRAIQVVERERERQLVSAQKARVKALEQVRYELEEREKLRRQLLRHTVIAQEEERSRIARELHDETAQVLTAFTLNLATLENTLPRKAEVSGLVQQLQKLSQKMAEGIYRLVRDLRPAQLDDLGLIPALKYLADDARRRLGLDTTLEVYGSKQRLDPLVETVIFRIAQEALTNISRHARTGQATMQLFFNPEQIIFKVCDQGIGFDITETLSPPRGWGLAGMRERAESVGGQFQLHSTPGKGTTVEITIPLAGVVQGSMVSEHGFPVESAIQEKIL